MDQRSTRPDAETRAKQSLDRLLARFAQSVEPA
jgi:hypothetical protein